MTFEEKMNLLAATIDIDRKSIAPATVLSQMEEWDSMAQISVIAMLDKKFKKVLREDELESLSTIQNILDLMISND